MSALLLDSLEVEGFRGFRRLEIERLGRVNLIVGRNSVGKSSVLEAVRVYAARAWPELIWEILEERDESQRLRSPDQLRREYDVSAIIRDIRFLFYGLKEIEHISAPIRIGSIRDRAKSARISLRLADRPGPDRDESETELARRKRASGMRRGDIVLSYVLGNGKKTEYELDAEQLSTRFSVTRRYPLLDPSPIDYEYVPTNGIASWQIGAWWDAIALTPLENEVLLALRLVSPAVEQLTVLGDEGRRKPIVRLSTLPTPVPLRSLGEGMQRVFGLSLALVNARNGFLLIDEFESGLHYSVQVGLWRIVLELAHRLDVQVFATTHSWDCIEAFQQATREDEREEGVLIRLGRGHGGDIIATTYDENDLSVVTRDHIEVR